MGNLWKLPNDSAGMTGFTKELGLSIEKRLGEKGYNLLDVEVNYSDLDKKTGYLLSWDYKHKHWAKIIIIKSKDQQDSLTIDRFWGIMPMPGQISTGGVSSSSEELRNTAEIYDAVTALLNEKFGKPISEHDGRSIYRAKLEERVAV